MKLNRIGIENFKGIKRLIIDFSDRTIISGENGAGKTTIYDAFQWLLFGKDSEGRSDFDIRPLDKDNNPIKGLVIAVQADIEIDGTTHIFRKEEHQKYAKKEFRGNETKCWIDEVPKKVGEYADYIDEIIAEDKFRLLTDLKYFCGKLHWEQRRAALLDIAGNIGTPEGFDDLLAALNGRTQKEYKAVLAGKKKLLVKEQKETNPRIDELQKQLSEYAAEDTVELENKRGILEIEVQTLDTQRQDILDKEDARQHKITSLNNLKSKRAERVSELRKDTSGVQKELTEKAEIERKVAGSQQAVSDIENSLGLKRAKVTGKKSEIELKTASLNAVRGEYDEIEATEIDDKCFSCGQKLPASKLKTNAENQTLKLGELKGQGVRLHTAVKAMKEELAIFEAEAKGALNRLEAANIELGEAKQYRKDRFVILNARIETAETLEPDGDKVWVNLNDSINKLAKEIGEPASDRLMVINSDRQKKVAELDKVKTALSQSDQAAKNKERITELEDREKELAQQIADIDKQLKDIADYKTEESNLLLEAVNGKFKHVEFKLFNELVNGEIEDCCEAMLNGTPYSGMSSGEEIFAGIDIVNVLSEHYGVSIPLFIDHAESLTLPIEAKSQVIELRAVEGLTELTVENKNG